MIHSWFKSRDFLLLQPKMKFWILFKTRFKSWFMISSGFILYWLKDKYLRIHPEDFIDYLLVIFNQVPSRYSFEFVLSFFWVSLSGLEDLINKSTKDHLMKPLQCLLQQFFRFLSSHLGFPGFYWVTILFKPLQGYLCISWFTHLTTCVIMTR